MSEPDDDRPQGAYFINQKLVGVLLLDDSRANQVLGRLLATGIVDIYTAWAQEELIDRQSRAEDVGRAIVTIAASMLHNILKNTIVPDAHVEICRMETGNFMKILQMLIDSEGKEI